MPNDYAMYQGYNVEGANEVNITSNQNVEVDMNQNLSGTVLPYVYEPMTERCIHRTICHEVPHVCPVNTRIINHHVYRHTYSPCYTCCEENVVSNVQEGSCCRF